MPPQTDDEALLAEQRAYYRAAAPQYDRPYAKLASLRRLLTMIDELPVAGDVLELACGTGQWTSLLAARSRTVTAVDASTEVLAIARERTTSANVEFIRADLFDWTPPRRYDTVFFAFWLSHVPPGRLAGFWAAVADMLAPRGRAIFVDDGPALAASEEGIADGPVPTVVRGLDDGSRFRIVKVFHDAGTLTGDLTALGWSACVRQVDGNIVGVAEPPESRPVPDR